MLYFLAKTNLEKTNRDEASIFVNYLIGISKKSMLF